jgi:CHAT domain-containing protein
MPDVFKIRVIKTGETECQVFAECRGKTAESDGPLRIEKLVEGIVPFHKEMSRTANTRRAGLGTTDDADAPVDAAAPGDASEEQAQALKTDLKITQEVGTSLFDFLFTSPVEQLFRDHMEKSSAAGEALPIRLFVEQNPKLSTIPWETLYDRKTQGFLSLSRQTPLIRAVRRDTTKLSRPQSKSQLRILGMVARPSDVANLSLGHIDAEGEQIEMRKAMKELEDQKKIELHWTLSGRQSDLEDAVIRPTPPLPWDVFHFIGHGGFDPTAGLGFLFIQEEDGAKADVMYPDDLRYILVGPNGPQLVVLNSCKGAYTSSAFSSIAADLTMAGVQAVVAMQFVVSDDMAKAFSRKFYECLSKGDSIGTALAITRSFLKNKKKFTEWAAPVLYLGSDDSPIFQ